MLPGAGGIEITRLPPGTVTEADVVTDVTGFELRNVRVNGHRV
ncbi:hypothetical protein [Nonomuraea sp. NPDC049504]